MKQIQFQMAFFFSKFIDRPDGLFYENMADEYKQPVILPSQPAIPGMLFTDSPVIQATSNDDMYNLSISNMRLDLTIKNPNFTNIGNFITKYYGFVEKYVVNRVGFVSQFLERKENPNELMKKYLNMPENASEVSIRYNKKTSKNGIKLNDVMNIQEIEYVEESVNRKGVLFIRDINSEFDQKKSLSKDEVQSIFLYSQSEFSKMSGECL